VSFYNFKGLYLGDLFFLIGVLLGLNSDPESFLFADFTFGGV
jgi:hypothetical protein